jgi:hypothetical protein
VNYAATILADTPKVYYKLGEASGNPADSSGNGLTLTAAGSRTYGNPGPFTVANSMGFLGTNGDCTRAQVTAVTANLSCDFWCYYLGGSNDSYAFDTQSAAHGYAFGINGTTLKIQVILQGVGTLAGTSAISQATWHYIAVTRGAATWKSYIDGAVDNANMSVSSPVAPSGSTTGITGGGGGNMWISNVAFYEVELTAAQILAHYNASK